MNRMFVTLVAVCAAALLANDSATAQLPPPTRILGPTVQSRVLAKAHDVTTAQSRNVHPDVAALDNLARLHVLTQAKSRFVIDLFPALELDAEVVAAETRAGGGATVFARLPGIELGTAVFTIEAGVLTASIDMPAGNYLVTPQADGTHEVARKAAHLFPPEREPRPVFQVKQSVDPFAAPGVQPDVPMDSGRLIDIMVVWTPAAQAAAGGAVAMQNLAQAAVDNANLTYLNSGVAQRLRLVHRQLVAYTERTSCGDDAFGCALDDITFSGDGYMEEVHALRDQHGADLVALLISNGAACGVAWLPLPSAGTSGYGFSVTDQGCAVGNKSFVHELGHNMGAHHDPYVISSGSCGDGKEDGAYCFSRGMVNLVQRWRTVMSYNNECMATPPGTSCTRIQYLSNPKLAYNGLALGNAAYRNNAHSLNKTAKAIAAYRPTSALHPVVARFADVPTSHASFGHIEFVAQAAISTGCGAGLFCPDADITRRGMAAFIERAMRASNWTPPSNSTVFTDVLSGSAFAGHIEAMRTDGITSGCTATTYCPEQSVTRAQMAAFLLRARCGASYSPTPPASATFADVPTSHPFFSFIEKMYSLGITGGCANGPLRYCPDMAVTRGQMAVFVERAYPFLAPSEACSL